MIESERFKLLYGPYMAPKCAVGDRVPCNCRGREVTVTGMTDAPIPWPCTRGNGRPCPVLYGDLIRAVRTESALAVAYHWGVCHSTVGQWRGRSTCRGSPTAAVACLSSMRPRY